MLSANKKKDGYSISERTPRPLQYIVTTTLVIFSSRIFHMNILESGLLLGIPKLC